MNLIFLSGPQGGGKTTLVKSLGANILIPELKTTTISLDTVPETRVALKLSQRTLENFECWQIANNNPDKVVAGNRCIYDQIAFNEAYYRLGWISKERKEQLDQTSRLMYNPDCLKNPHAICLNPGFGVVKKHLEERWSKGKVKWREEDANYISTVCEVYEDLFRSREEILYINHEIDLDSELEIKAIKVWVYSSKVT